MDQKIFVAQLDGIVNSYNAMRLKSKYSDLTDLPKHERQSLVTQAIAAINRIAGSQSTYSREIERILLHNPDLHTHTSSIIGVAQALRDDLMHGYLKTLSELVHAEVFSDFIEMAEHLLDNGFKDPAAVLVGATLESHLKKLTIKHSLPVEIAGKPIKADKLNADLTKANAYTLLDQKSVTAWLDLRNKAAHGSYNDYNKEQVKLLIDGIRNFISRVPA